MQSKCCFPMFEVMWTRNDVQTFIRFTLNVTNFLWKFSLFLFYFISFFWMNPLKVFKNKIKNILVYTIGIKPPIVKQQLEPFLLSFSKLYFWCFSKICSKHERYRVSNETKRVQISIHQRRTLRLDWPNKLQSTGVVALVFLLNLLFVPQHINWIQYSVKWCIYKIGNTAQ